MNKPLLGAIALLVALSAFASDSKDLSISFRSEDPHTHIAPRREARDARLSIVNRDGSVVLMLLKDSVSVQLTDRVLAGAQTKPDASLIEEMLGAGVRLALGKSVEYALANIRSADVRDGALLLISDKGEPVFKEVKVNGKEMLRDFAAADAARFAAAVRGAMK